MAKTVSAEVRKDAQQAKHITKVRNSLGQELTLEAMDRSLQKPVDPKKLIASKVPTGKLYWSCGISDCTFCRLLARWSVALLGPRQHLCPSPRLQAG